MLTFDHEEFVANLSSAMDVLRSNVADLSDGDPDSKVFSYVVADVFETLNPDVFTYTDGSSDMGIDFTIRDGNSFKIYQCKATESLGSSLSTWDADTVNQISEAIDFMCDPNLTRTANKLVKDFRDEYRLSANDEDTSLTAVLAIEGSLTDQATERFKQIQKQYGDQGISVQLVDENTLFDAWHSNDNLAKPENVNLKLKTQDEKSILKQNGWMYGIFEITSFLDGMKAYENGLFDLNVRSNLKRTSVNNAIRRSLETKKGISKFIHLNNGLVIVCHSMKYKSSNDGSLIVELKGAQVINGCQTLTTIWDFYKHATDDKKREIEDHLRLFAKVITKEVADKDELLNEIVVASNNQNAMKSRNLKSNSSEQRNLQACMFGSNLRNEHKYFLVRKDGEFDSFLESKSRSPRKQEFEIQGTTKRGKNRYRFIENEELAKIWWSWIGNASKVNTGGIEYFSGSVYRCIFEKKPSMTMLDEMAEVHYRFDSNNLETGTPSHFQYLLAMAVNRYLSAYFKPKLSGQKLKEHYKNQLINQHRLPVSASQEEVDNELLSCNEYLFTTWKNQMGFPLTEVASFLLSRHYAPLTPDFCRKLISHEDVAYWLGQGMNPDIKDSELMTSQQSLLFHLAMVIDKGVELFFTNRKSTILGVNRSKLYLGSQDSLFAIKNCCLEANENWRNQPTPYKEAGITLLDTLPEIL